MKKVLLSILILVTIQSASLAQHTWGLNFNTLLPTGDLRNDSPALLGVGATLDALFQVKDSPIYLGGSASFSLYGQERQDLIMPPEMGEVDVTRRNSVANVMGLVRYKPQFWGTIRPFAEFTAGYSFIYTNAEFHEEINGECNTEFENVLHDATFTYGLGGGLEFAFKDWSIELSVRSLQGSTVNYLTPSSMEYNQMIDEYRKDVRTSRLEYMMVNLGIRMPIF